VAGIFLFASATDRLWDTPNLTGGKATGAWRQPFTSSYYRRL